MMRPVRRRSGPMLTPLGRTCLGLALIAGLILTTLASALDTSPDGEGDPIPPYNHRSR